MTKIVDNPIAFLKESCKRLLKYSVKKLYSVEIDINIEKPPRPELGDLSVPIGFQLSKLLSEDKKERAKLIKEIPKNILNNLDLKDTFFNKAEAVGGYLNFFIDFPKFSTLVINTVLNQKERYGSVNVGKGETVIVEHTSANPIHPLHIGTARNSTIGDSIARIYKFLGYNTIRRFYVDDVGKQVAYLVYALKHVGWKSQGKIDHWLGVVYSCINSIAMNQNLGEKVSKLKDMVKGLIDMLSEILPNIEKENITPFLTEIKIMKEKLLNLTTVDWRSSLDRLKDIMVTLQKKLKEETKKNETDAKLNNKLQEFNSIINGIIKEMRELSDWLDVEKELKEKWGEVYEDLLDKVKDKNVEEEVTKLIRDYEFGITDVKKDFREVCKASIRGFEESLKLLDIHFDGYDWESELVWSGLVNKIIKELDEKGWISKYEDSESLYLDIKNAIISDKNIRRIMDVSDEIVNKALEAKNIETMLPPNLTLTRSDGTTLYPTRDIAYSIYKFSKFGAKKVFNVIGVDQSLTQKQIRAALYLAGYREMAENQIHVAYEMVTLPGAKLSSRRGRYITFDEVFIETKLRAIIEIDKRWKNLSLEEKEKIAEKIAAGAIRYALTSVSPMKKIVFDWRKVLDFEQNSGPFLQYAYARAHSVLRKTNWELPSEADFSLLDKDVEKELIIKIAEFPNTVLEAAKQLRPDIIAEYGNKLAMIFNSFYQRYRILQAENEELKNARILLVEAFRLTLKNTLTLLGIPVLERM